MKATWPDPITGGGRTRRWYGNQAVTALILATVLPGGGACSAAGSPSNPRVVVLVLPGAGLDDLTRADLPHLSALARGSAGAWVAAWGSLEPPAGHAYRLSVPFRADARRLFEVAQKAALPATDLLWIDLGSPTPASSRAGRTAALGAVDELAGGLWGDPRVHDLWLLAPPEHPDRGLAPFFWRRRGGAAGLLRSGSTHMTGVITGEDVAATLAGLVNAPYAGSGCWVTPAPPRGAAGAGSAGQAVEALRQLGALAERTDRVRAVANRVVQWLLLLLIAASIAVLRTGRRLPQPVALIPLLLPALLLLDGARRGGDGGAAVVLLGLIAAGMACLARRGTAPHPRPLSQSLGEGKRKTGSALGSPSPSFWERRGGAVGAFWGAGPRVGGEGRPWRVLACVTLAACVVAVLAGDVFRWSVLGYSIRLGVRFYGIGNEFMGWCAGAALLAVGVPRGERVRPGAITLLLAVALLLGHPSLGSKVGGGITALAAVGVEAWPWLRRHRGLAMAALIAAVLALVGLAAWDSSRLPELQTHLGRLAVRTFAHGPRPFLTLAAGKLRTELRVTWSLWGVLLAAGIWLILEARRHAPKAEATRAISRLLLVALVAYLCNDSGVIAAALMLSYATLAAGEAIDHSAGS